MNAKEQARLKAAVLLLGLLKEAAQHPDDFNNTQSALKVIDAIADCIKLHHSKP